MDKVFIEGLAVDSVIGAYNWERGIRQVLVVDLQAAWDIAAPAARDELSLALDYSAVAQAIGRFARDGRFMLVESFAEALAAQLMEEFAMPWLWLRVSKPGAVPLAIRVGVEIERGQRAL